MINNEQKAARQILGDIVDKGLSVLNAPKSTLKCSQ